MPNSPFVPTRRRVSRRPGLFWPLTLFFALVAAALTATVLHRAQATVAALGTTRSVAVATQAFAPGDTITDGGIVWRELPLAALAPDSFNGDPVGRTVTASIVTGEVVMTSRVGGDGVHGPIALMPTDSRALVVPVDEVIPAFSLGSRVDLLAAGRWVAREAVVVEIGERAVTVAVDEEDAPDVSVAILEGTVSVALVGVGEP